MFVSAFYDFLSSFYDWESSLRATAKMYFLKSAVNAIEITKIKMNLLCVKEGTQKAGLIKLTIGIGKNCMSI